MLNIIDYGDSRRIHLFTFNSGISMDSTNAITTASEWISYYLHYTLFKINETPITPLSLIMFGVVVFVFFIVSRLVNRGLLRRLLTRFEFEQALQYTLIRISHYAMMIVGFIIAFQFVGVDLSGLTVIFGLLSVGIGFGLQTITSNFVSGLILLFERPIRVGDRVTVSGTEGEVVDINMRATSILSLNNITYIVPNSEFVSNTVVNWSHGDPKIRLDLEVGVSYGSDLDVVIKALKEVATNHPEVLKEPAPDVFLTGFGDSSWDMSLRLWISDPKRNYAIRSAINCEIVRAFRKYGVEIPFPQRDLHLRSPLPLPVGGQ